MVLFLPYYTHDNSNLNLNTNSGEFRGQLFFNWLCAPVRSATPLFYEKTFDIRRNIMGLIV